MKHKCEVCRLATDIIYNAKSRSGPWGWFCHIHWLANRASDKLGTGLGQKYDQSSSRPVKLEG